VAVADTVARLGETQLLVIAPGCSAERALLYAEQLGRGGDPHGLSSGRA